MDVPPTAAFYGLVGLAGLAFVLWLVHGGARSIGAAAGALPGELAGGVALGVGDSLGVPRTNESECDLALREGRLWDASFACPATKFIGGLFGSPGDEKAKPINLSADSSGVPFY